MFFDSFFEKRFKNIWLRLNIQAIVVGLIIGTVINTFFYIIRDGWITERVLLTYLISYMITMSITNMISLSQHIMHKKYKNKWTIPILFYFSLIVGMILGTELTFFLISMIYKKSYNFIGHLDDLKFNLFIALVVGTIVYINSIQKDKYELEIKENEYQLAKLNQLKTNAELQALQSKINPHFLYNALNSIISLIHIEPNLAEEMTLKLSKLFRHSLNTTEDNFSFIKDEIEIVTLYLDIEKVRFQHKLKVSFEVNEDMYSIKIPRFLLQPLVENSIKHGINKMKLDGEIKISIKKNEKRLMISIHDNGPAFDADFMIGYGLQSTYDKLNLLYPENHEIQINNGSYKEILIIIPAEDEI